MNRTETIALIENIKGYYPAYYQRGEAEGRLFFWAKVLEMRIFMDTEGLRSFVSTVGKDFPPVAWKIIIWQRI